MTVGLCSLHVLSNAATLHSSWIQNIPNDRDREREYALSTTVLNTTMYSSSNLVLSIVTLPPFCRSMRAKRTHV